MEKSKTRKIIIAPHAGFCFGVKRAMEMAEKLLEQNGNKRKVFSLGPIIHNPQAIEKLEKMGLKILNNPAKIARGSIFIVRSHGVSPEILLKLKKNKVAIVDATCPFVKKAQLTAERFLKSGRRVIIYGDPAHAEVVGINGHAKNTAWIVKDKREALKLKNIGRAGLLSQTTLKAELFNEIVKELKKKSRDLLVVNTICLDSSTKKAEVRELAGKVEVMVVVGGKQSNNTKKLAEVSRAAGTKTFQIETAAELKPAWFKKACKIGLAAGASTPDWIIKEVLEKLNRQ
jgi:4-hydroxy-3-methylbut-2-enyl diphosphate reductase